MHAKPQDAPSHVDVAFMGGAEHAEQLVPHDVTAVFETHWPLHRCVPATQVKPHVVPSHVAVELAGGMHGAQLPPHEPGSLFERHNAPHA